MPRSFLLAALAASLTLVPGALAQTTSASGGETKLIASDGGSGDRFGFSVSAAGSRALVGAYNDDGGVGSAYVYAYNGTTWVQQARLTPSVGTDLAFGGAVALSSDRAIVSTFRPGPGTGGAVYVFRREGEAWTEEARLTASGGERAFGSSVSISGDRIAVGASAATGSASGAAYIYAYDGTAWAEEARFGGFPGDSFGYDVSISGDRALVGAFRESSQRGAAYVYDYNGTAWAQRARLISTQVIPGDRFGISVSVTGDRALIGADEGDAGGNAGGRAYMFTYNGSTWVQQQRLTASDRPPSFPDRRDDRFGVSVSLSGDQAIIGATFAPGISDGAGAAYLFAFDGTTWTEQEKRTALDGANDDRYGQAVSLTPGVALVGAWGDEAGRGSAYVYGTPELEPMMTVTAPERNEFVLPGEPYLIEFDALNATSVDLFLVERSQSSDGTAVQIAADVPAASGVYEWDVPGELFSPSTFILIADAADPSRKGTSERFRVRDKWRLVRVVGTLANPEYERVALDPHAWGFDQLEEGPPFLWPASYWDTPANSYSNTQIGFDPFIGPDVRYDPEFFQGSQKWEHPSWDAWVRAFGMDGTYASLEPASFGPLMVNQPNPAAVETWKSTHKAVEAPDIFAAAGESFKGVCVGMSTSLLMAFQDPDRFDATFIPTTGGSEALASVPLNDEVRDAIHSLQFHQYGVRENRERDRNLAFDPVTPRDVLARLKARLESDIRDLDAYLWFASEIREFNPDGTRKRAAHAVAVLGMQRDPSRDGLIDIAVFDPNIGPEFVGAVTIDSTDNSWTYDDDDFIGDQGTGLYLSRPVIEDFVPATATWPYLLEEETAPRAPAPARRTGDPAMMSVEVSGVASAVTGAAGEVRFGPGVLTQTLPMGYAQFPITGAASTPYSYRVPVGEYDAEVTADSVGAARLAMVRDRLTVGYERSGGVLDARDVLALGSDGLTLTGGSGGETAMTALATVGGEIRRMRADSLAVPVGEPMGLSAVADTSAFRIEAPTTATTYDLTLDRAVAGGIRSFYHAEVALEAGATHTIRPNWDTLGDGPVAVDVDLDGDGTPDETRMLENEPFPVAGEPGSAPLPSEPFAVRAFPNPSSGAMHVELAAAEGGSARVALLDLLGREVAVLHDGPLAPGVHTLTLEASALAPGVYLLRAEAGEAVVVRKLTLTR